MADDKGAERKGVREVGRRVGGAGQRRRADDVGVHVRSAVVEPDSVVPSKRPSGVREPRCERIKAAHAPFGAVPESLDRPQVGVFVGGASRSRDRSHGGENISYGRREVVSSMSLK